MKLELFLPVLVFLAVAIPLVMLLNAFNVGGEYRVWIAIGVGALATGYTQKRLADKKAERAEQDGTQA